MADMLLAHNVNPRTSKIITGVSTELTGTRLCINIDGDKGYRYEYTEKGHHLQ